METEIAQEGIESAMRELEAIACTDPTVSYHLALYRVPEVRTACLATTLAHMAIDLARQKVALRKYIDDLLERIQPQKIRG